MATAAGTFLIDWERLSIGHREGGQATAAWHRDDFGTSPDDYTPFAHVYGHDVTAWPGYQVICGIRSLCTTLFALRHATASPEGRAEADHRLACPRGTAGPSPKPWNARKRQRARPAAPGAVHPA